MKKIVYFLKMKKVKGSSYNNWECPVLFHDALPMLLLFGFTGTPISKKDKNTREVFGDYIDVYDMTQAVEDGATRPVYYESRVVQLKT